MSETDAPIAADWNHPLATLPEGCDVLVVGAGPAGSACARWLALAGVQVLLVDGQAFPRDKVCGDGLVPDAHAALRRLGVHADVMRHARASPSARCVAPSGRFIDVPGELAVISRRELDALLCRAAIDAGVMMGAPVRFEGPILDLGGRVCGATLSQHGEQRSITAKWVVLATGASPAALLASGMCNRRAPSGMALRTYVRHPGMVGEIDKLRFVWHPRLEGGYGWIFPGPDGVFNIGAGILDCHDDASHERTGKQQRPNLRLLFDHFLSVDPAAARLMREGEVLGDLKGAPLRCDLSGATWSRPGLLVTGEAAGATYSFTGEGIGKALETGMAAAESLLAHAGVVPRTEASTGADALVEADYRTRLQALVPRFKTYRQAASFNRQPWLVSLMIWRAAKSPRIVAKLSDILNERRLPGSLLTLRGLRSMLWP
jgi:menaquinone-9 beta-reductase